VINIWALLILGALVVSSDPGEGKFLDQKFAQVDGNSITHVIHMSVRIKGYGDKIDYQLTMSWPSLFQDPLSLHASTNQAVASICLV